MLVDYQCHWWPPSILKLLEARERYPLLQRNDNGWIYEAVEGGGVRGTSAFSDLDRHLSQADAAGVDMLVLGPAGLGEVMHLPVDEAVEIVDRVNAEYAAAQAQRPDRIMALAALPMHDSEAALAVLDRAVTAGLRGVSVLTSNNGRPVASAETLPIYRRLDELGLPVVLHPGVGGSVLPGMFRLSAGLGWMYQTAAAAVTLIDSGTLDECPSLSIVHPHLGGVLPYIYERIDHIPGGSAKLPMREYLRTRFYVDAVAPTPGALPLAIRTYGLDHVVFGSDYPFVATADVKQWIAENVSPEEEAAIHANRVPGLGPA